ncbi:MAG: RNA polymerase sigma-70 factor [Bacilli bacterium]
MDLEENILLKKISKGDKSAYEILFKKYFKVLVYFSNKFVKNEEESKDIVQDLFFSLWTNRTKLPSIKDVKNYLFFSVRNKSLNYLKSCRFNELELNNDYLSDDDFLKEMMDENIFNIIYEAVKKLPPKCSEIMMYSLKGLKNKEIAEIMSIDVATVRSQIRNAKKTLKENLSSFENQILLFYLTLFLSKCF